MLLNFKKYLIFSAAVLFTACNIDQVTPIQVEDYTPKLVVNGELNNNNLFSFQLTNSKSVSLDELPSLVTDATVNLSRNQETYVMMYDPGTQRYRSSIVPQPGDRISLDIRASGYLNVNSTVIMPAAFATNSTITPNGGIDSTGQPSDLLTIQFTDNGNEKNYYRLNFYYFDEFAQTFYNMAFSTNDPSLAQYNSIRLNDGSVLFNDELFNGQGKSISTVATFGLVVGNPEEKYMIRLESITESLYKYLTSLQRAQDAKEGTFASSFNNAVVIYSNVNNGLGIVGGTYAVRDTLY